jgi:hemerythrin-like domain-containing protein
MDSGDRSQQEVLHRRLEASQHEGSRNFAQEGASEHQLVEQRLQKMSSDDDKMSEHWMADLIVLRELVDHHVDEEESTGFSCARDDLDKGELENMGMRFRRRKEELMVETPPGACTDWAAASAVP